MNPATRKLIIASGNAHKVGEFESLLAGLDFEVFPATVCGGMPDVDENGDSFAANARLKAEALRLRAPGGAWVMADDSGLEVDALNGAPGIYSARYAGAQANDADNTAKLLEALKAVPTEKRSARFRCAMVYLKQADDPAPLICEGVWEGRILDAPRGRNGFGYDPVFLVPERGCASAELPPEEKNRLSHRGQALRKLVDALIRKSD